jgi:hypothetical protein
MRAIRRTGAGALVGGVVMLGVVTGGSPAAAEPIEHDHFHDVSSEVIEGFCDDPDLTVRFDLDVRGMFLLNAHGPDGLAYGMEHVHGTTSATNLANDRTFTEVFTFANKDLTVTDNGDGTLTIVGTSSGSHRVIGPDGQLLFMEAGRMMFQFMVYTNGTPTDPTDDEEVAGSFTVLRSFTGQNDLEGRDYCDDVHEFIG